MGSSIASRLRGEPLRGLALAALILLIWVTGALYCSGYEALSTGIDNWPGSLIWSAVAVLPWLALFEWSKSETGRRLTARPADLAAFLAGTAILSLSLEAVAALIEGNSRTPLALALMRRFPAVAMSLVLILWARQAKPMSAREVDAALSSLAPTIDWVSAADNYVELHIGGRVTMRRMTMAEAEQALASRGFVRIHRRYLVNRQRISAIRGNGEKIVRLADGAELPVGKKFASNLLAEAA
jgi:hypothetical protein